MRNYLLAAASGISLLCAPAAFAQDAAEFDGPYVGGSIGLTQSPKDNGETILFDRGFNGSLDTITTTANTNAFSPGFCGGRATVTANTGCISDRTDAEYHVRAGWDAQLGSFVIGVVGEFGKSEARDSVSAFSTTPASYTMTRQIKWEGSFRARAGYVFGSKTLGYLTAGPSYAKIDNSFATSNTQNAFADNGDSYSWGVSGGGGIEHKISDNLSFGVEYLYTRYNEDDYRVRVTQGIANAINPFILFGAPGTEFRRSDPRFDFHSVRATAAFRF
ncbi:MAG: outer membrane beta-barrel protein [Pseudomonadota bacterium]